MFFRTQGVCLELLPGSSFATTTDVFKESGNGAVSQCRRVKVETVGISAPRLGC